MYVYSSLIKYAILNIYMLSEQFRDLMLSSGYNFNKLESSHNIFNCLEYILSFKTTLEH